MITLILTPYKKAIERLQESLNYCVSELAKNDRKLYVQFRAASIQAFEFTYDLSWKMLKRYLELTLPNADEIDSLSFQNLIRTGCEQGLLLSNLSRWKEYRHARNITSHTYSDEKAEEVYVLVPEFLTEAIFLLNKLQERAAA
jgi:nucleotidyltransferase substrate binding protein (TIGR01987 family)